MSDIIIYTDLSIEKRSGQPPTDQSVVVAQLQGLLADMTSDRDAWKKKYEDTQAPPVAAPKITGFVAAPTTIKEGESTTLSATFSNVKTAKLNGEDATFDAITGKFSKPVMPPVSRSYVLDVVGLDGSTLTSVTVMVTVEPVVVVEPPPVPVGAENPLFIFDSTPGLTRDSLYLRIVNWKNSGGDWIDANGQPQGTAAFGTAKATKGQGAVVVVPATSLVNSFDTSQDVQVLVRASAIMAFRSRSYPMGGGPELVYEHTDGSVVPVQAIADAEANMSTAYEMGNGATLGLSYSNKAYIRWPAPKKPVKSARINLTPYNINESGTVSLFKFAVHLDRLAVVEPYLPMKDCFVETESFRKGTVPYPTFARIARENAVTQPDAAWNQAEWVTRDGGGEALQINFDPRGSSALSSAIPFPGGMEADEVEWEFKIKMMPSLLTGARDGFKLFAGPTSKTKSDDNAFVYWCKTPEYLGTFGTLLAGNGGSKAHGDDGWSLRFDSWNSPPAGHPMHGRFLPMQYAYHPEQIDYYGDGWSYSGQNTAMIVGQEHTIRQRAKINTVIHTGMGSMEVRKDAEFDSWLDGLPVLRKRDFRLRTTLWPLIGQPKGSAGAAQYYGVPKTNLAIGRIWLNSYHGGTSTPLARCSFQVWDFRARIIKPTIYIPPLA